MATNTSYKLIIDQQYTSGPMGNLFQVSNSLLSHDCIKWHYLATSTTPRLQRGVSCSEFATH